MPYARRYRKSGFRSIRGKSRFRPTAYTKKRMSWWKRRRARWHAKRVLNPNTKKSQFVKITYADQFTFDCGGAALNTRDFRLNSIFDPDATGAGGTPSSMTQYAGLFKSYKVVAAKVGIKVWNTGTTPAIFGFTCQNDEYTTPSARGWQQLFVEQGTGKYRILQPPTAGTEVTGYLKWFGKIRPLLGERYASDNACATIGGNPAKVAHMYTCVLNPDGTTVGAKVQAIVKINYYVKFFNQNPSTIVD